jgi:hypothetical protein
MPSERVQRQIDRLLDQAEAAAGEEDWPRAADCARKVLVADPENQDAKVFLAMADAAETPRSTRPSSATSVASSDVVPPASQAVPLPTSFASGRYTVRAFLGEGAKKRVYLAHDTKLARDVPAQHLRADPRPYAPLRRVGARP